MIREKLNSSALDIMYYTSPLFRTEIINSLTSELNRLYKLFCQKNPTFTRKNGKVSFVAHSLGTVIIYDILTSNNYTQLLNTYGEDSTQVILILI
jgi:phospholipase DDHD1